MAGERARGLIVQCPSRSSNIENPFPVMIVPAQTLSTENGHDQDGFGFLSPQQFKAGFAHDVSDADVAFTR